MPIRIELVTTLSNGHEYSNVLEVPDDLAETLNLSDGEKINTSD